MSKAVDRPSPPVLMISLNRQFVSSAVPKPANIRIVQSFDRYIDAYGPRVYGYWPGNSPSSGPYTASSGMPDIVMKSASRVGEASTAVSQISRFVVTLEIYFNVELSVNRPGRPCPGPHPKMPRIDRSAHALGHFPGRIQRSGSRSTTGELAAGGRPSWPTAPFVRRCSFIRDSWT